MPEAASDPDLLRARARLAQVSSLTEQIATQAPASDAENRAWIAKSIISNFTYAIAAVILALAVGSYLLQPDERWKEFSLALLDVLKGVLLPVVTLILGYYFGQSSKSDK